MHVEPKIEFHVGQNQPPNIKDSIRCTASNFGFGDVGPTPVELSYVHSLDSTLSHLIDQLSNKGSCYRVVTILEP